MIDGKSAVLKKNKAATAVQVWYGVNESYIRFEVLRWQEEFKKRHPEAQLVRLVYKKNNEADLTQTVHQATRGGGMFSTKQLVILEGFLAADKKSELAETILEFVQHPAEGAFVLLVQYGKTAWSKGFPASLKQLDGKELSLREFNELPPLELEKLVQAQAKELGAVFAPGAARLLVGLVGGDVMRLSQEVAKLSAFTLGREVRAADLDLLVARVYEEDVFAFLEAVGRRDFATAAAVLHRQFEDGNSPQSLVGLLTWHVRVLAGVREVLDKAVRSKPQAREIAGELGLHPFVVTKALQQIPYFSAERVAWLYDELSELDVKLKTSRLDPELLFAVFLGKLANVKVAA